MFRCLGLGRPAPTAWASSCREVSGGNGWPFTLEELGGSVGDLRRAARMLDWLRCLGCGHPVPAAGASSCREVTGGR